MQQVGTGSRFWWRALDAQSPQATVVPNAFKTPQRPFRRSAAPAPTMSFTLQIPRGDRRLRSKRKASKFTAIAMVVGGMFAAAGSAAAIAIVASDISMRDVQDNARHYATQALIGLGFGIDQITLTGQRYTIDTDVFDALDLGNVKTFAALDTAAALKRIERISWVDTAQITRVFPGLLNVEIKERSPAAIWRRGESRYLIDATGRTLGPVPTTSGWILPHVAGEGANTDAPLLLAALTRHKDIQAQFHYAERIAERRWSVVLNNGSRIELGADREVEGLDYVAANSTLRKSMSGAAMTVDVRTTGRAVVRSIAAPASMNGVVASPFGVQAP